jgi:hypothetical protein
MVSTYKPIEKPLTWWQKNSPFIFISLVVVYIILLYFEGTLKLRKFIAPFMGVYFVFNSLNFKRKHGTYFLEIGDLEMRWKLPEMPDIEWRDFTDFKRIVIKPKEIVFFRDSSFMDFIPLPQFAEPDQAAIKEEISAKAKEYNIELIIR